MSRIQAQSRYIQKSKLYLHARGTPFITRVFIYAGYTMEVVPGGGNYHPKYVGDDGGVVPEEGIAP
jgi:hypothetical protein